MEFRLSPQQEMVRDTARKFAREVCEPIAAEIDRSHRFPRETFDKMTECGITAVGFPVAYGGTGLDKLAQVLVTEEIARKCAATAAIFSIHQGTAWTIHLFGTEDQKQKYLRPLLTGGVIGAFSLTEPNAGSDASNVQTVAVEEEDCYVLNGTKCFCSNGGQAGIFVILAMTNPELKTRGISAFIVEKGTPGLSIGKTEDKMGICASDTSELIIKDLRVPKENLLGKLNRGFNHALASIDGSRITVAAAQALGIAEEALDLSVQYVKDRVQFGKPIAVQQGLQWYIADMKTRIEATRSLTYRAAALVDQGEPYATLGAMAKYFASETAVYVTDRAIQLHGGYGFMRDYPLERMYRDAKITEIYEGTSEIQKLVISREVIGKIQ
jgi:alkylation response protein AidB-like acyl-CoA dehydrogenase